MPVVLFPKYTGLCGLYKDKWDKMTTFARKKPKKRN